MKKQIDKTKKSNIKCEHCKHCEVDFVGFSQCKNQDSHKFGKVNYWNRCKCFEWKGEG